MAQQADHPHKYPLQLRCSSTPSTNYKPTSCAPNKSTVYFHLRGACLKTQHLTEHKLPLVVCAPLLVTRLLSDLRTHHGGKKLHQ